MQGNRPEIVIIAALAVSNRVIGRGLSLPWHLPEDLRHFKRQTYGHPIIVGRKTFESIVHVFGGPLPNRRMLVLTSLPALPAFPEIETFASLNAALCAAGNASKVFVGGGGTVYATALDFADTLELTLVEGAYEGDVYFPPFEHLLEREFTLVLETPREGYRFVSYRRRVPTDSPRWAC